jgi:hypothetical protein
MTNKLTPAELAELERRYQAALAMPESIRAAKRVHVQKSEWLDDWWVGYGKDDSCQIEGTPNHWRWLAMIILGLVDEKDSPYSEDKPTPEILPALIAAARERDTLAEQLQQATEDSAGHELSSDAINEARQYLKLHMGIEMAFFDDCIHNAVAMYLQAKADGEAMREELSHRFIICNAGDTVCGLCGATSGHGERLWHEDACVLKPHPGTTLAAENQRKTDEVERLREVLKRVHGYAADIRRHICAEAADPDEPKFARPAVAACVGLMNRELAAALAGGEVQRG